MSEKVSLNNHGLDQEWQTNEIRSFLRAQWWWPHALSCLPLAASHKSSSHFLESNQPTVFPLSCGHKQWQTCLVWHRSAEPYRDPTAALDEELLKILLNLCTWAVNTWRYVLYEWGVMEAVTSLLLLLAVSCQLSITHFGKLAASSTWKLKIRKGICRVAIQRVLGFKKDRKLKAVESKKAYQYHHGYVTLNKPLVMIHSWLLAKWNRILFIVLSCKTCTPTRRKSLQKGTVTFLTIRGCIGDLCSVAIPRRPPTHVDSKTKRWNHGGHST